MKSGSKFSLFVVLAYLCIKHKDKVGMGLAEDEEMAGIEFVDIAGGYDPRQGQGRVLHMLCLGGGMSFSFGGVAYNVGAGDYVIMPDTSFASPISASADCNCMAMSLSEAFVASMALRSNYGVVGHLSLLQNPVMRLTEAQCRTCCEVMGLLADRVGRPGHLFRKEMMGHLLMVHILDLYDIHARSNSLQQPMERAALIVRDFISMLYDGGPTARNGVAAYASRLCVTPHYLTEVCRSVSGRPASYWIERFAMREVVMLLARRDLTLTSIAERLGFSSLSYFSRYVRSRLGITPSEYRSGRF